MKKFILLVLFFTFVSCAGLAPKTIGSSDLEAQGQLIFKSPVKETVRATKSVVGDMHWRLLYEGEQLPKRGYSYFSNRDPLTGRSYDRAAWDAALSSQMVAKYYIQAKTPTSAFSYGSELFFVIFESPNGGSVVSLSASSGQVNEKNKLESYINNYASSINQKID